MLIRDARQDERTFIREQRVQAYEEHAAQIPAAHWQGLKQALLANEHPDVDRIVAELDGKIVGSVVLFPAKTDAYGGQVEKLDYPEIRMLAVSPEVRGKGVATALISECIRRSKEQGHYAIGLHTGEFMKTAMRLYERLGFERLPEFDFEPAGDGIIVKAYRLSFLYKGDEKMEHFEKNLVETRGQLLKEIAAFSCDDFNKKPDPNQWSAAEVCHHLVLVDKTFAKVIVHGLKKESNKMDPKNMNFLLDRTKKVPAPEIVVPSSEPIEVQQAIEWLNDTRNEFLAVLNGIKDRSILAEKSAKHPIYGVLPLDQWVEMLYLHEQRHIQQIKEIRSILTSK